jgi:ankyrin repeat protein
VLGDIEQYHTLCRAIEAKDNKNVEELLKNAEYSQVPAFLGMEAPLMHQACIHNNIEAAKLLINAGFNVNDKNLDHDTTLDIALKNKKEGFAEFLLLNGARANTTNDNGAQANTTNDEAKEDDLPLHRQWLK